mgnify:CR=1 FL=1
MKVATVTLISQPYQLCRAYATCRKLWPEVEGVCACQRMPLPECIRAIGTPTG